MILKWPEIQSSLIETNSSMFHMPLKSYQCTSRTKLTVIPTLRSHSATQTKPKDRVLRVIPEWYEACEFVRDNYCQTDSDQESFEFKLKLNKQICCCCVIKKRRKEGFESSSSNHDLLGSESSEFSHNAELLYDDYSRFNLIGENYENVRNFDPCVKIDTKTCQNNISVEKNQCKLSNDIRKAINAELKEKFAAMSTKRVYNDHECRLKPMKPCVKTLENEDSFPSFVEKIPSEVTDSNKSLVSVKKIRSKLQFLRVFKSSSRLGTNLSFSKIQSEIKYQKM
ncbi:hypothetical protein RN001_006901 [Aquatica leii]|uniref:Uncharacterized protein n=1 Tax=Aquatica leii TaxID=1421715 RepID=A0AAN7Q6I5_9COLE|nr:hypothetical protein RN001_006901 [Aquatica leii]